MKRLLRGKKSPVRSSSGKRLILVTAHRRESFGKPLRDICKALSMVADGIPNTEIIYPVHLNPNVKGPVKKLLATHPQIHLIEPVGYDKLVYLMEKADLILTDSGGIQEEAPTFGTPILVMRNVTERPEGVQAGFSWIVGQNPLKIFRTAKRLMAQKGLKKRLKAKSNPYGDGKAAGRVISYLSKRI